MLTPGEAPDGVTGRASLGPGEELAWGSLLALAGVVLRHARLVVWTALGVFLLGVGLTIARRGYVAWSSLTPEAQGSNVSRFAGLAAQFGLPLADVGGEIGDPVQFYAELLVSRELLETAAQTQYHFPLGTGGADSLAGSLVELYHIRGATAEQRLHKAADRLKRDVEVSTRRDAGLIRLTVRAPWPALAVALNRRLLDLVGQFNVERRQSQAGAQRRFLEGRVAEAKTDLAVAEGDLRTFLERNHLWQDSPALTVEEQRLLRAVDLRQQLFTQLSQDYEQARIAEVRNTPVVTIVDGPEGSARRSGSLALAGVIWLMFGVGVAVGLAYASDSWDRYRSRHPEAGAALHALRTLVRQPLRRRGRGAPVPEETGSVVRGARGA